MNDVQQHEHPAMCAPTKHLKEKRREYQSAVTFNPLLAEDPVPIQSIHLQTSAFHCPFSHCIRDKLVHRTGTIQGSMKMRSQCR